MSANSELYDHLCELAHVESVSSFEPQQNQYLDLPRPIHIDNKYTLVLCDEEGILALSLWSLWVCDSSSITIIGKPIAGETRAKIGEAIIYNIYRYKNNIDMYEIGSVPAA